LRQRNSAHPGKLQPHLSRELRVGHDDRRRAMSLHVAPSQGDLWHLTLEKCDKKIPWRAPYGDALDEGPPSSSAAPLSSWRQFRSGGETGAKISMERSSRRHFGFSKTFAVNVRAPSEVATYPAWGRSVLVIER
jgi:hypothetical protein